MAHETTQQQTLNPDDWLTVEEAADYARHGVRTIHKWLKDGLRHRRPGRKILIMRKWLNEFIDQLDPEQAEADRVLDELCGDEE